MEFKRIGVLADPERILYAAFPTSMQDLLRTKRFPSRYFGVLFSWPVQPMVPGDVFEVAKHFIESGAVYISAWGKDCERVHDIFDEAIVDSRPDGNPEDVILTTWLPGKFLRGALWDFIHVAFPAAGYEKECGAAVMIFWDQPESEVMKLIRGKKLLH